MHDDQPLSSSPALPGNVFCNVSVWRTTILGEQSQTSVKERWVENIEHQILVHAAASKPNLMRSASKPSYYHYYQYYHSNQYFYYYYYLPHISYHSSGPGRTSTSLTPFFLPGAPLPPHSSCHRKSSGLCSHTAPPHFAPPPVQIPTGGPGRPLSRTRSVLEENKAGQSFLKAACLPAADATWGRTALPTSLGGKCACSKHFTGLTPP